MVDMEMVDIDINYDLHMLSWGEQWACKPPAKLTSQYFVICSPRSWGLEAEGSLWLCYFILIWEEIQAGSGQRPLSCRDPLTRPIRVTTAPRVPQPPDLIHCSVSLSAQTHLVQKVENIWYIIWSSQKSYTTIQNAQLKYLQAQSKYNSYYDLMDVALCGLVRWMEIFRGRFTN